MIITKWIRKIRILVLSAIVAGVIIGIEYHTSLGTLCSLCPLGFLQVSLASKSMAWGMLLPVMFVAAAALFLGKAFCSWVCPAAWLKEIFKGKKSIRLNESHNYSEDGGTGNKIKGGQYGYGFLIGALAASFIVGFPVFCLICPVGLFFGFIYAVYRVSVLYTPGWELIIFPGIFIMEIFVFKSWCKSICPLGAILRFMGRNTNLRLKPKVTKDLCLDCQVCQEVCPERLDPLHGTKKEMEDCNLCMECYAECPRQAIKMGPEKRKNKPPGVPENSTNIT